MDNSKKVLDSKYTIQLSFNERLSKMLGKLLTLMDVSFLDTVQRKAAKDMVKGIVYADFDNYPVLDTYMSEILDIFIKDSNFEVPYWYIKKEERFLYPMVAPIDAINPQSVKED